MNKETNVQQSEQERFRMRENQSGRSDVKQGLLLLAMFPAMAGILVGPIMMFYPAFLGMEWLMAGSVLVESAPTTSEWILSPLVSATGILITYAVFRIAIELDRDVEQDQQPEMGQGYLNALEEGEINGFLYVCNLLLSWELAKKVIKNRTPEGSD